MSELRRMVIDEVESVLKEFVVAYDNKTHFVRGFFFFFFFFLKSRVIFPTKECSSTRHPCTRES